MPKTSQVKSRLVFHYGTFLVLLFIAVLLGCAPPQPDSVNQEFPRIVFDSAKETSEALIPLTDLGEDFPSDWSEYEALVLELKASSSQRMNLKVYCRTDDSSPVYSRVRFHPYPKVWIRAAIPIALLSEPPRTGVDMAAVGNRSKPGYYLNLRGPFTRLKKVDSIAFEMEYPVGMPELEIRSIQLARMSPGDVVLGGAPIIDALGQYIPETWPGKAENVAGLEPDWRREEVSLEAGQFGYGEFGGYEHQKVVPTGFFRVEKIDGRWWFVTPDGHLFLSVGCDVIRPTMVSRKKGRDSFFAEQPPTSLTSDFERDGDSGISFFTWNLLRRHGESWREHWIDLTFRRMDAWGLNTIGNWSDPQLWGRRKPYTVPLASWQTQISYLGLPDVYSDEFLELADERAREQCLPRRDDPWLLGYFLANEPPFPQRELQTTELILSGPETATKRALQEWLATEDSPERRKRFIGNALEKYIQVASSAVRKYDPNHLNLGMRSGGRPTDAEIRASQAFDVYSVNIYQYEIPQERVAKISELTGKPILIGEFHFGTPGRGLAASLVQVRDQSQRGVAYQYYVEQGFAMPEVIGTHWFQWADQPATGRFDGENYNIGLVDVTDRPYEELVAALKRTHQRLYSIHVGQVEPSGQRAARN